MRTSSNNSSNASQHDNSVRCIPLEKPFNGKEPLTKSEITGDM